MFSNKKVYATLNSGKDVTDKLNKDSLSENNNENDQNIWIKCPYCNEILYKKDASDNLEVCPKCKQHLRMTAMERCELLIDEGTFEEFDEEMETSNHLNFPGYAEKLIKSMKKTNRKNNIISGIGKIYGIKVSFAAMDFQFVGGSLGVVAGEKLTRTIERGIEQNIPVIIVSASGGARMQEGLLSLMQMAKTSGALKKLNGKGLPYISVPTNPTTGGVTASFAMLGDIIVTEPGTLIGFAGPRVIEQTINQKLPKNFQTAEFLLEHGMIDVISDRKDLKDTLNKILSNLGF